jgi:ABC-2 type transport system permease protein
MRYAALVARREFLESARTKGFWFGILLFPIMILLATQVPIWLEEKVAPARCFVLVDQSGSFERPIESALESAQQKRVLAALQVYAMKNLAPGMKSAAVRNILELPADVNLNAEPADDLEKLAGGVSTRLLLAQLKPLLKPGAPPFVEPKRLSERVPLPAGLKPDADLATLGQELKPYLRGEKSIAVDGHPTELSAAILIPRDITRQVVRPGGAFLAALGGGGKAIEYWSANVTGGKFDLKDQIEQAVNAEIRRREYQTRGMDMAAIREVERTYAPFTSLDPKKEAGKETVKLADKVRQWAPSGFVYLLWVAIFTISQMLLGNIIEEKSNRIIEVLLSSVTPGELMMGKLFGIAAIGLTMVGAWVAALFGILSWEAGGMSDVAGPLLGVLRSSNLLPMFALYFLLGYLMYAGLILSLGSVCNTLKEAQSYMGVITMVMMVPLLTLAYIPSDPNGVVARVLSWVPLYTPFAMMNRATANPPLIDWVGTMVLLIGTTLAVLWMAGRIFRIGILRTGQPPKIIEMLQWIRR